MSYEFYKVLHFTGLAMVLISLGALIVHQHSILTKRTLAVTHGLGLLVLLVTGFGMLARLGIHWPIPGWAGGKLIIWLVLGAYMGFAPRWRGKRPAFLWWTLVVLTTLAGYLAISKPF